MIRSILAVIGLLILTWSCTNNEPTSESSSESSETVEQVEQPSAASNPGEMDMVFDDSIELPAGWKLISEARGDVTKDELQERVQIIEATTAEGDAAPERRIRIYKLAKWNWTFWQEIAGGVLPADAGGMVGDPFEELSIERSCIVLRHFGGSRIRWSYTHRYRWQNEAWEMIGATVVYGAACDYWHEMDYNLSTGKIVGQIEVENCDTETSSKDRFEFSRPMSPLPRLDNYEPGTTAVAVPGRDLTFYF